MNRRIFGYSFAAVLTASLLSVSAASAEQKEIRLAKQFSIGSLPLIVMENQKLLEKHAKASGLGDVKVTWQTFAAGNAMNDAILSGSLDFAVAGTPPFLILWDKTKGNLDVRAVSALSSIPFYLNTRNRDFKTLDDLKSTDRIALPAVRVSNQAVMLQMAAAKAYGDANYRKFDELTVSMAPPDASAALLSGSSTINSHFGIPPLQFLELENPEIHRVLSSNEVLGGPHSYTVAYATSKFRKENPRTYAAYIAATKEAVDLINKDKRKAAEIFLNSTSSKLSVDWLHKILQNPDVRFTLVPENTSKMAEFMTRIGTLKNKPESWKDYFFPEIHAESGS